MYVDSYYDRMTDIVYVMERVNGKRVFKEYPCDYTFYIDDPRGAFKNIYGDPVSRIIPKTQSEFKKLLRVHSHKKKYESDISPTLKCLEQNYLGNDLPKLNIAFFDIETDFDPELGYSTPADALNPITSIAVYLQWLDQMICLAVPPKGMAIEEAEKIADEVGDVLIFNKEEDMLNSFISLMEDVDVISGWNSSFYDITYTTNRIISRLGRPEIRRLSPWGKPPLKRRIMRGESEELSYDYAGLVHLDYLELYRKHATEQRQSYALDSIAEIELGDRKVAYDGTLDHLYNNDFKKFLEYNIQDTMLLDRLDKKLKYIELTNAIAHDACVLMPATLGAVSVCETAITIEAHRQGMVVPDKKQQHTETRAAGGWVSTPKKGFHKWIGSVDLASLYPSTIRALNMSPETIWAQIRPVDTYNEIEDFINEKVSNKFSTWWNDKFNILEMDYFYNNDKAKKLILDFEDGTNTVVTGADIQDVIFKSGEPLCISANGTIFRTDKQGIIPGLLTRWYNERVEMKGVLKKYETMRDKGIKLKSTDGLRCDISDNVKDVRYIDFGSLMEAIENNDAESLNTFMRDYSLVVKNGSLFPSDAIVNKWKMAEEFWDKKQYVKKILLNSAYGSLLNEHCRYFDHRMGQSTTLTGRSITKHMASEVNKIITGDYDHYGEAVCYGDTDSNYFTAYPMIKNDIESGELIMEKEDYINLYDDISREVNKTFPKFLKDTFNVPLSLSTGVIDAEREIVAESALFIKKKRYAALITDNEGRRCDVDGKPGKLKAMGLDLKRADTPKFVQDFLIEVLMDVLTGCDEKSAIEKIREFKDRFNSLKSWEKGIPKAVNGITKYRKLNEEYLARKCAGKVERKLTIPGHVKASMNWNHLRETNNELHVQKIVDGHKVVVCYLKPNDHKFDSIAYPVDETHLPDWFLDLPFDDEKMLQTVVDKKINNLLSVLKWDLSRTSKDIQHMEQLFTF